MALDDVDRSILSELLRDGRMSVSDLAERVHVLARPPTRGFNGSVTTA